MTPSHQLVLPINIGTMIPEDDSVRLLAKVTDELNYEKFYKTHNRLGRPSSNPKVLVRVLLYAAMNGIWSSRKIETACRRDINFIWLLDGHKAPDHNTLSRFRSGPMESAIEDLFYQMVSKLGKMKEIEYKHLFVDGTKIEANANKYTFVWKKSTQKHESRLQEKIRNLVAEIDKTYGKDHFLTGEKVELAHLDEILEFLEQERLKAEIEFVHGKGTRKTGLQRHIERLRDFRNTQAKYDGYNQLFEGRNSFSKTDTDATFMHMKEDHMRNSQLKPGYNVQIGVEGEYIVGVDLFSERSDQLTFIPFMNTLKEKLPKMHKNIVADAGYESEENYVHLVSSGQHSYIKPSTYEITRKRSFKNQIGRRENMIYNPESDEYTCHNQKTLKYVYTAKKKSKSGYESEIKVYECKNCTDCPHKTRCTKAQGNKRIQVAVNFTRLRSESQANITSEIGKQLRMNRSIQVEGAFGVLKENYGFRRFLLRGKKNVKTEFILLCFGFNINKLHRKMSRKKQGVTFFELKAA